MRIQRGLVNLLKSFKRTLLFHAQRYQMRGRAEGLNILVEKSNLPEKITRVMFKDFYGRLLEHEESELGYWVVLPEVLATKPTEFYMYYEMEVD
jgi:hypothetical protein